MNNVIIDKNGNVKKARRKTISDELITKEVATKIINKVFFEVKDVYNINQIEVVSILLKFNLSNKTIAKLVNEIIPTAHATQGSIASLIKYIRNEDKLLEDLMKQLDED